MSGHTFVDNGRYPADPNNTGVKYTFEQEMSNLTFYDNTLVNVAGRVVGGEIESEKPLGLALSKNNIGKSTLQLSAGTYRLNVEPTQSGTIVTYEDNLNNVAIESASTDINSQSYRKGGNNDEVRYIYITTDSITGEFSAMVPPLQYTINSVEIASNSEAKFSSLSNIDASNPLLEYSDSTLNEDGKYKYFNYNASTILEYRNTPTFTVEDMSNSYGAFGEASYKYIETNISEDIPLYTVDTESNTVTYQYGYPLFVKNNSYSFKLMGFEEYYNYDADTNNPVIDRVPLDGTTVTITNEMSSDQSVYVDDGTTETGTTVSAGDIVDLTPNQLLLDSVGEAIYEWSAGFPNIVSPYTRSLNIIYDNNGQQLQWSGNGSFNGIVLGSLPTGNNFVTSGPDQIHMILRDPAGSNSMAFLEEGTTYTQERTNGSAFISNSEVLTHTNFGTGNEIVVGSLPGAATITSVEIENTLDVGFTINANRTSTNSSTTTITTTSRINTSDSPDYVGANGDVFIGSATNIIFGKSQDVTILRDAAATTNVYSIGNAEQISIGSEFATGFKYTQSHIENNLIPNLYVLRNALIQTVSASELSSYVNNTNDLVYLSTLSPTDEKFGSSNFDKNVWGDSASDTTALSGPSYTIVKPEVINEDSIYTDDVLWYNEQIDLWIETLAYNEKMKVDVIDNRDTYLSENHSFDAGASVESSVSTCTTAASSVESVVEVLVVAGGDIGFSVNNTGVTVSLKEEIGGSDISSESESTEECVTTGYTLADDGYNDALTIDVYNAPDKYGAIFYTRGGQSSCPYEDAAYTKYYEPGTEISTATMRVEVPEVALVNSYATDVPAGGTASYTILLRNNSETGDDVWFDLKMVDVTNPDGARISMDGSVITEEGRSILIAAGTELSKTIQLNQTQEDVLDYENIAIVLASQCQSDPTGLFPVIADTVYLSAYYVPTCSEVVLEIDETTLNMFTSDVLELEMSGFDRYYNSFEAIRLEYKYANNSSWTVGREYVLDSEDLTTSNELLPDGGIIYVSFPMDNSAIYPDGTYQFRLVAACEYGSGEITTTSETIVVTKDMVAPQVLGEPNPSSGILYSGDKISILYNEDIRTGELTDANNFIVTGILNDATIAHDVALRLDGTTTAAAYTEASVSLNSDFALDMWINYSTVGTIFEHGTGSDKFIVSIVDNGKLSISVGDETIISENIIPSDTWCFLTLNYTTSGTNGVISALAANDASDIQLFNGNVVSAYSGSGIISLGKSMTGALHEVTLWNRARTIVEAQSEMYSSKAASTPNLIGYWKFDEANGSSATDVARYRHMVISDATWYLNNDNLAAEIGTDGYISLPIATVSAGDNDNFAMEMWFRGATQTDATLWSINDNQLAIKFNAEGKLTLVCNEIETQLSSVDYLDNVWHHIALNVLRNGTSIVYVDGNVVSQLSSSTIPAMSSDVIVIGANRYRVTNEQYLFNSHFAGEVDEIRYWVATLNGNYINDNRFNRITPSDVAGLAAYYTFEEESLDGANQVVTNFVLNDMSENSTTVATSVSTASASNAPSLKSAPALTNIQYTTVASEREIVFTITELASRVEGTTINFTVRNVRDENNNLTTPVVWSAYINCNRLVWSEDEMTIDKLYGESATFTVEVENLGSANENWVISNLPIWLSANKTQGTLSAISSDKITFTVSDALSLGQHEETIYLYGNDEIYTPLVISLNVTTESPDWQLNRYDYELNMNVIGRLHLNDKPSYDANDIVAAFIGDDCVGLASPEYYSRYDSYYILMDIYGNTADNTVSPITFKVWDATTGYIYPVVTTTEELIFDADEIIGSFSDPFIWNATEQIEVQLDLETGWNWMSIPIQLSNSQVEAVFDNVGENVSLVKSKDDFAQFYNSVWSGMLTNIDLGSMYSVQMNSADKLLVTGDIIDATQAVLTVNNGWNWIGYNQVFNLPIDDALADYEATTGDVIKGKVGFSIYQDYQWVGTLRTLEVGEGYKLNSVDNTSKDFTYPSSTSYAPALIPATKIADVAQIVSTEFEEVSSGKYSGNMTVVAILKDEDLPLANVELGVFVEDECREVQVSNEEGILFLTISGDGTGDNLQFKAVVGNEIFTVYSELTFTEDAHYGNIENPYLISLSLMSATEGILAKGVTVYPTVTDGEVNIESDVKLKKLELFNAQGAMMFNSDENFTKINLSMYNPGVYLLVLTDVNNNRYIEKIIKY
ncbi:MAG: T9SS type A sorting domain-containing protein [bacterium]